MEKSVKLFGPIPSVLFRYESIVCRPSSDNSATWIPKFNKEHSSGQFICFSLIQSNTNKLGQK